MINENPINSRGISLAHREANNSKRKIFRLSQWFVLSAALVLFDGLFTYLALRLSFLVRFHTNWSIFSKDALNSTTYYSFIEMGIIGCYIILFLLAGLYNLQNLFSGLREYMLIFYSTSLAVVVALALAFFYPNFILSRGWLLLTWGFSFLTIFLGRFIFRRLVSLMRKEGYFLRTAVIVGANQESTMLASQLMDSSRSGLSLLGFVDVTGQVEDVIIDDHPVLGDLSSIDCLLEKHAIDEIIITTSALDQNQMMDIFKRYGVLENLVLRLSSGLYEVITTGMEVKELAGVPLLRIHQVRMTGPDMVMKKVFDCIIGICLLPFLLPVMGVIALLVKFTSPGPIIHKRKVLGVNGRVFNALKFRSMYVNGDEILASRPDLQEELKKNHKLKDDPRITRVGKFIRRTSLDELPQIWNIFRGQMSLVGPRMIAPDEIKEYNQWSTNLLTVKPGITGLWQVSGRSDVSYSERVRLDMYYIRNWSIWFDLQLMLKTIPAVLSRRGAY